MIGAGLVYVGAFLFVLTIVVFFHELGHFWVARKCGVKVEVFSVGFGKEIFGWYDKKGTRWKLSLLPLGGYVKFLGDDTAASTPDHDRFATMTASERVQSFHHQSVWRRMAIVAAGPVANFLLAILIFAAIFMFFGRVEMSARVDSIQPGSAAERAGFQPGDVVVSIDGAAVESFADLQRMVMLSAGEELTIDIDRGGERLQLVAIPESDEFEDALGNTQRRGLLGISRVAGAEDRNLIRAGPVEALWLGTKETYFIVSQTFTYLGRIFTGKEDASQIGGPLRIAQVSGQVAQISLVALIHLTGVLSVSIGLLNFFPIPMLDGGHLLFYGVEVAMRRPLSERVLDIGYRIGFALVISLMIFATWNDLLNLHILDFVSGIFS